MQNLSCEYEFDLHENQPQDGIHFLMKGVARNLVSSQSKGISEIADLKTTPARLSCITSYVNC